MPHAQPALHSRREQFAEAGLKISLAKGEFDSGGHESAREPMEKMPHRSSSGSASLRSAGLEPALSGIRGAISTSRSRRSGPVEL
jgi:hypothetical protein